jgi:hypothetical protein
MAGAETGERSTNQVASGAGAQENQASGRQQAMLSQARQAGGTPDQSQQETASAGQNSRNSDNADNNQRSRSSQQRAGSQQQNQAADGQSQEQAQASGGQSDQGQQPGQQPGQQAGQQSAQAAAQGSGQENRQPGQGRNGRGAQARAQGGEPNQNAELSSAAGQSPNSGGGSPVDWNRLLNNNSALDSGPITGTEFGPWSDRLRDVEEMIDLGELRNEVATARDRARSVRQEFRREHKKPDWAVVRSQIMNPLVEVRDRIADELARRESNESLVPIDRDPVPTRYSDLVRKYYENLGKEK